MVIYNLSCLCGFQAEGWFADEAAFAKQDQADQVICPACQSISMRAKLRDAEENVPEPSSSHLQSLAQQLMQWADGASPLRQETIENMAQLIPLEGAAENIDMNDAALGEDDDEDDHDPALDLSMEDVTWEEAGSAFSVALADTSEEKPIDINWQVFRPRPQQSWRRHRNTRLQVEKKSAALDAKEQELEKNVMELARALVSKALLTMLAKAHERKAAADDAQTPDNEALTAMSTTSIVSREELEALREEGIESLTIAITDKRRWN